MSQKGHADSPRSPPEELTSFRAGLSTACRTDRCALSGQGLQRRTSPGTCVREPGRVATALTRWPVSVCVPEGWSPATSSGRTAHRTSSRVWGPCGPAGSWSEMVRSCRRCGWSMPPAWAHLAQGPRGLSRRESSGQLPPRDLQVDGTESEQVALRLLAGMGRKWAVPRAGSSGLSSVWIGSPGPAPDCAWDGGPGGGSPARLPSRTGAQTRCAHLAWS